MQTIDLTAPHVAAVTPPSAPRARPAVLAHVPLSLPVALLVLLLWLPRAFSAQPEPTLAWELDGFAAPESVRLDPARGVLYVSNVAGGPTEKDGNGFLSRVTPAGELLTLRWVEGLDAPKGMAIVGDRLYVSDIDRLVVIALPDGRIVESHAAPGAKFLNDVTADAAGRVYVSDMLDDALYRLDGDGFGEWLRSPALDGPNGLLAEPERLLVASWGTPGGDGAAAAPGQLLAVTLDTRAVSAVSEVEGGIGHLDGLEALTAPGAASPAYLISDWINGALLRFEVGAAGAQTLLDLPQGSADIGWDPAARRVFVPLMVDGKVQAYDLP